MLINPKYQKNPTFNKSLSSPSEVTCGKKSGALGKLTKFQATPVNKGFQPISKQRLNAWILQDQSAKLLPKERVCNCLKDGLIRIKIVLLCLMNLVKKSRLGQFTAMWFDLVMSCLRYSDH